MNELVHHFDPDWDISVMIKWIIVQLIKAKGLVFFIQHKLFFISSDKSW